MKRASLFILIFFGICYLLGSYSKSLTDKIYSNHARDVISELRNRLDQNETIYTNGQMLEAYLIGAGKGDIQLNGKMMKWSDIGRYVGTPNNKYKIAQNNDVLLASSTSGIKDTSLTSIEGVDKVILIKNTAINIVGIAVAIAMYKIYYTRKIQTPDILKVVDKSI